MKSNHLAMMLTALSLSVSPLATHPAGAQQDTQNSGQAQTGGGAQTEQPQSGASGGTGADCSSPDASGACPQAKGGASGNSSTETKSGSGSQDETGGATTTEQKPKSGSSDSSGSATSGSRSKTQSGSAETQSNDQNSSPSKNSSTETNNNTTTKQTSNNTMNVNITVEQRTEIRQVVKEVHVQPVREVSFAVSVGTRIPKKVRLERLPPRIVKIVPEYEGYEFFILADGRIIIVDPSALTIVYIVTA
ncbi:DUF1236 domain-containing protein (plasmid) [Rhizobium grahamii]|uniref:DUF1236 domain-containing protein n=1 Tax=Rhizobium grahamii TaxID=1120045 RepID=A0A5Q0CAM7_9HYPH|nr:MULTISPECIES: DUF1236 domain-containing protein [Rhizobium]QFY62978.1 DUF1236 domain-containing protein [Rhizobium grahamii]QRM52266.1 DUF1236 domain-containing protein [Rhizobium sp. BG6]